MDEHTKDEQKVLMELSEACETLRDAFVVLAEHLRDHQFDSLVDGEKADIKALLSRLAGGCPPGRG